MRGQLIVVFSLDHLKTFFFLCVPLVIKIQTRANHSSMTYYGVITDLGLHWHLATLLLNAALLFPASWEEYRPGACQITGWEVVGEVSEKVFTLKCREGESSRLQIMMILLSFKIQPCLVLWDYKEQLKSLPQSKLLRDSFACNSFLRPCHVRSRACNWRVMLLIAAYVDV